MSAEPSPITSSEPWTQWDHRLVNGVYPLRRLLDGSSDRAVFLTEYKAGNVADAAIKLVRADAIQAKALLAQWQAAARLVHPHLVRIFDTGRLQSKGQEFVFVVMEYGEQTLAQILRHRALHPAEVNELLPPALDALAFLHRNQRVHGRLKPSNIFAVGDQLKLGSDTVRVAGKPANGLASSSAYDAPELHKSGYSVASDIWSLGVTLVETFTRQTVWPAIFPAPFVDTARRCLSLNAADRPTAHALEAIYKVSKPVSSASNPSTPERSTPQQGTSRQASPQRSASRSSTPGQGTAQRSAPPSSTSEQSKPQRSAPASERPTARPSTPARSASATNLLRPPVLIIAAAALAALIVWIVVSFPDASQAPSQPDVMVTSPPAAPPLDTSPSMPSAESDSMLAEPAAEPPATPPPVMHEVMPNVPDAVREKIKGRIYVTVRVLVEPDGTVVGALMENPGSSRYFARLADNAARQWQFAPADNQGRRVWLLRFQFTSDGVTARAIEQ